MKFLRHPPSVHLNQLIKSDKFRNSNVYVVIKRNVRCSVEVIILFSSVRENKRDSNSGSVTHHCHDNYLQSGFKALFRLLFPSSHSQGTISTGWYIFRIHRSRSTGLGRWYTTRSLISAVLHCRTPCSNWRTWRMPSHQE